MSATIEDHLKNHANRCLLVLFSDSLRTHIILNEQDCSEKLVHYGSIKDIQLTEDRRAAFVDFDCEHAPLLVARCFELHKSNPKVPMPKGATTLLPGCSVNNFLYLHDVPHYLSNLDLIRHFTDYNNYRPVTVIRPGSLGSLSSRVIIVLNVAAESYTHNNIRLDCIVDSGKLKEFYAIPQLEQLMNYENIFDVVTCKNCKVVALRDSLRIEEEQRRGPAERECAHVEAVPSKYNDDYSTPRTPLPSFPDISEPSERLRWGGKKKDPDCCSQSSSTAPVTVPTPCLPPPVQHVDELIPTTLLDYLRHKSNRCLLVVVGKTRLFEIDCRETLSDYGLIKNLQLTPDCRAAFVEFDCHHVPILVARCFGLHHVRAKVRMPKGVAALLPGCSIDNFAHWLVPSSLPTAALHEHLTEYSDGRGFIIHRPGTDVNPSMHVVVEFNDGASDISRDLRDSVFAYEVGSLTAITCNGTSHKFYAVPPIKQLNDFSKVSDMRKCDHCNITNFRSAVQCQDIWKRGQWLAIQQEPIEVIPVEKEEEQKSEDIEHIPLDKDAVEISEEETGVQSKPMTISDYISELSNRCLLIVLGKAQLGERDCWEALIRYGSIKNMELTPDLHATFVEFNCSHAPLLVARCFGYREATTEFPMPSAVSALLPGCSIDNFLYLRVPSSLPTVGLREHLEEWFKDCEFVIHRAGTVANPSVHVVVELSGGIAASSFLHVQSRQVLVREVRFNGSNHTIYGVPPIKQLLDSSSVFNVGSCKLCKVSDFRSIGEVIEQKMKRLKRESSRANKEQQVDQWTSFPLEEESESEEMAPLAPLPSAQEAPANATEAREPPVLKGILRKKGSVWASQPATPRPRKSVTFDESDELNEHNVRYYTTPDSEPDDEEIEDIGEMEKSEETREVPPPNLIQSAKEEPDCRVPPPALISAQEMAADSSDDIVEESERIVDRAEDVAVEEAVETGDWKEEIESCGMCIESLTVSDEEKTCEELDDLLSEEEDQFVGPLPFTHLSSVPTVDSLPDTVEEMKAYDIAAGNAPPLVMVVEEEEDEESIEGVRDRMDEPSPAPSSTVSLVHEDTESSVEITESSDDETIIYEYVSDCSSGSSDTVIGEGIYGRYVVDPEEWDEEDQIRHGYRKLNMNTIEEEESQEEDALSPVCSTQEVSEKEEKKEEESTDEEEKKEGGELQVSVANLEEITSEIVGEKIEVEQPELASTSIGLLWNRRNEVDSDDESVEEKEERDLLSCSTREVTDNEEDKEEMQSIDGDEKEETEEKLPEEGELQVVLHSSTSIPVLDVKPSEHTEETMEMKQLGIASSSAPIDQLTVGDAVDQEKDEAYRSIESEYHNWLTREDPKERGDSTEGPSSDSEAETVPLPSSLSVLSWGKGIEIEEKKADTVIPEEKGVIPERVRLATPSTAIGGKKKTLGWGKTKVSKTTVSPL